MTASETKRVAMLYQIMFIILLFFVLMVWAQILFIYKLCNIRRLADKDEEIKQLVTKHTNLFTICCVTTMIYLASFILRFNAGFEELHDLFLVMILLDVFTNFICTILKNRVFADQYNAIFSCCQIQGTILLCCDCINRDERNLVNQFKFESEAATTNVPTSQPQSDVVV